MTKMPYSVYRFNAEKYGHHKKKPWIVYNTETGEAQEQYKTQADANRRANSLNKRERKHKLGIFGA